MPTVESKYKNPDKYIEKLKSEKARLQDVINLRNNRIDRLEDEKAQLKEKAYGKFWFTYKDPGAELSVNLSGFEAQKVLDELKLGNQIICFGEVSEIVRSKNKNSAEFMIKSVHYKGVNS